MGRPPDVAPDVDPLGPPDDPRALVRRVALRRDAARRGARVRVGGVPVHAVRLDVEHERRDHAVLSRRAFWLVSGTRRRAASRGRAGWTKFASLIVAPLWLTYPTGRVNWRFLAGFVAGTLAAFSILLLDPHPLHEIATFWHRTVGYQFGRDAPWSLWDWRQYHARGLPTSAPSSASSRSCSSSARSSSRSAAPQVAAPARRVHGGAPGGVRDGADVLALHVHPVVLPVRRDRAARPSDRTADARGGARSLVPGVHPASARIDEDRHPRRRPGYEIAPDGEPLFWARPSVDGLRPEGEAGGRAAVSGVAAVRSRDQARIALASTWRAA